MFPHCELESTLQYFIHLLGSALAFQRSGVGLGEKHAPQVCNAVRGEMRIPRRVGTALTHGRRRVGLSII